MCALIADPTSLFFVLVRRPALLDHEDE